MGIVCPYCKNSIDKKSRDHIFPDFLGGRRTIICCYECNNNFGRTFEAAAAVTTLHPLHVSISSWGLKLKNTVPPWRRAYEHQGMKFDIASEEGKTKLRLSRPIVERNARGQTIAISFPDRKDAEKAIRQSKARGKSKEATIETIRFEVSSGMPFKFQLDKNLNRTALKMCAALSTFLPEFSVEELAIAQVGLLGTLSSSKAVCPSFIAYSGLDSIREPLSHLVYVERGRRYVYGVVQFFGVIQLYCLLGPSKSLVRSAHVASLDALTGKETFRSTSCLDLSPPTNISGQKKELEAEMSKWLERFRESAIKRNASAPPKLAGKTYLQEEDE